MTGQKVRNIFGANVRKYRTLKRWSQARLAEKIDISTNMISEIETGKKFVSVSTLGYLCEIFEVEACKLFETGIILPLDIIGRFSKEIKEAIDKHLENYKSTLRS
jgi:transcriptional regulator with XRE-family HTH domain